MEALVPDERVRACVFDALLLDVLGDANTNVLDATLPSDADDDHPIVDFQADLDALDALIEQHIATPLRLHSPGGASPVAAATGAVIRSDAACAPKRACDERSSGSASESSSEASSAPKRKSAPGGNTARKRQREELRSLRESAAQLEDALQALKTKTRTVDDHARQITELENIHLSKLVNDHVKVAQSFERALRKHRSLSASEILTEAPPALVLTAAPRLKEMPLPSSVPTSADLRAFEALEQDVDARYPDVERVFRDVGLAECRTNVREATVETRDGVLLSFKTSRLIPFSVSCINETAIRIAQTNYPEGPGRIVRRRGGTVSFKKQFQVGDVVINVRGVSKRYVEATRIVLIWSGVSEWTSDGDVITINEKGWGIIQPFPSSSSSKTPLSMLQSYIAMTPGVGGGSGAPQPKHIAVLSDVVLPSYQEIFDARFQQLENTLVHDSLVRRRLVA